jgi:uncharacterized protein (TIGR00251 family)
MAASAARPVRLVVTVQPRHRRNEIVARAGATLRVRVTAPPVDGAANAAVVDLLARALDCPRSAITIVRGHAARTKLVEIAGLSAAELAARLPGAIAGGLSG